MTTLFLLNIVYFIFLTNVKAQKFLAGSARMRSPSQDDSVNNYQPSLPVVIGLLSVMFVFTLILILYAKLCYRTSSSVQTQDGLLRSSGIDKKVIESLPFFRFSCLKGSREGLECAVCLAKFEDIEILRLLPKCKHAFHITCIDVWLEKHSTCPLCRQNVGADDLSKLPHSDSLRFLWNKQRDELGEESNVELHVQREENNCHGSSSRFSIVSGSVSLRRLCSDHEGNKVELEELMMDYDENYNKPLLKFNHKINVVSGVVFKNRWSNVSSSDLVFLNSEMVNDASSARFYSLDYSSQSGEIKQNDHKSCRIASAREKNFGFETKALNANEKRSMSEITVHPRFTDLIRNRDISVAAQINVEEEKMRRLWLPIARKTVKWFANRETSPPYSQNV